MGFTVEHQLSLLSAVAAVLNLSNLSFSGGDGSTNRARGGGDGKACTVAPAARGALTKAARLLAMWKYKADMANHQRPNRLIDRAWSMIWR